MEVNYKEKKILKTLKMLSAFGSQKYFFKEVFIILKALPMNSQLMKKFIRHKIKE